MRFLTPVCLLFFFCYCNSNKNEPQFVQKPIEWELTNKLRYNYKLNATGKPDTTFVYNYRYENGVLKDSTISFTVQSYNGDFIASETNFRIDSSKAVIQEYYRRYNINKDGKLLSATTFVGGKLLMDEKYTYNDSNLVTQYRLIQQRTVPQGTNGQAVQVSNSSLSYDTVTGQYKYDNAQKVIATTYFDNRGTLLRNDVNLYSGNIPLSTLSVDGKGDTLQQVKYQTDGKGLRKTADSDSVTTDMYMLNGVPVSQVISFKNKKEKIRSANVYDEKGRKVEESIYKAKEL